MPASDVSCFFRTVVMTRTPKFWHPPNQAVADAVVVVFFGRVFPHKKRKLGDKKVAIRATVAA